MDIRRRGRTGPVATRRDERGMKPIIWISLWIRRGSGKLTLPMRVSAWKGMMLGSLG
jgi:hypothetical protein